jgi:hypothetical protein
MRSRCGGGIRFRDRFAGLSWFVLGCVRSESVAVFDEEHDLFERTRRI